MELLIPVFGVPPKLEVYVWQQDVKQVAGNKEVIKSKSNNNIDSFDYNNKDMWKMIKELVHDCT